MDPILKYIGPILTVIGALSATFFTYRTSNRKLKADSGNQIIDQQQEDLLEMRKELADLRRNQRIQGDYINQLRIHIADGQAPPPPAWPANLIT